MQPLQCVVFVLVSCLAVSAASTQRTVSNAERTEVRNAFQEGSRFTLEIQRAKAIIPIAKKLPRAVSGILSGIGTFFKIIGFLQPKDKSIENEMKKGFDRVVGKLDDIESALDDILKEMKVFHYKTHLMDYHARIGLMEKKLKAIVHAPNKVHAIDHFKKVYNSEYEEAGTKLVTLILDMNVLQKVADYTQNHRPKMVKFMRTLVSLLMTASTIEVANEKFNDKERGVMQVWKYSFTKVSQKMIAVDNKLVRDWKKHFKVEVEKMAYQLRYKNHQEFSNGMYNFFKGKYPWRHWFTLSYDPLHGSNVHHLRYNGDTYIKFRYYNRRNYVVSSSSPSARFNRHVSVPRFVSCRDKKRNCKRGTAAKVSAASRWPSAVYVTMQRTAKWAWKAEYSRYAVRDSTLQWRFRFWGVTYKKDWWLKIIYFG